jgi:hypothetical protein
VTWVTEEPTYYQSSPNVKRGFCSRCGSSVSWQYLDEDVALLIGSFDHPEDISPSAHMMADQQLPWLKMDDGLPRYPKFPPDSENQDQGL